MQIFENIIKLPFNSTRYILCTACIEMISMVISKNIEREQIKIIDYLTFI